MQLSQALIPLLALLPVLVAGDACVVGGSADKVSAAKDCCFKSNGTWFSEYPVQAICVLPANTTSTKYQGCITYVDNTHSPPPLDLRCITGETDPTEPTGVTGSPSRVVRKRDLAAWMARNILGA